MRRFVGKNSAGLRVRTNPSLQSEQIGIVKPDGIISFMDEVCSFLKSLKHYTSKGPELCPLFQNSHIYPYILISCDQVIQRNQ